MQKHDVIHKIEVRNILHCYHRMTKPRPQLAFTENCVKFGCVVFEIHELANFYFHILFLSSIIIIIIIIVSSFIIKAVIRNFQIHIMMIHYCGYRHKFNSRSNI